MTLLFDVNLLFVLHQPNHPNFTLVSRWFRSKEGKPFATCPITESGLVRLLIQSVAGLEPFASQEARDALKRVTQRPGHVFWPDTPSWLDSTAPLFDRLHGYRQTTDAYLLGLAIHNKGTLATLDRGIHHLAGTEFARSVELIKT